MIILIIEIHLLLGKVIKFSWKNFIIKKIQLDYYY